MNLELFYNRWQQLNDWLLQHQGFWQPAPFMEAEPEWTLQYPELACMVADWSDAHCNALDDAPAELAKLVSWHLPALGMYEDLVSLPELSRPEAEVEEVTLPEVRAVDMPGRKRLQSGALTAAVQPLRQSVLDWCCGKGHLSRTLAPHCPERVEGYEWNAGLVRDGNRLAARFGDPVSLHCQDVMAENLALPANAHGVALHACGELHRQLIRRGSQAGMARLSISPCCYHLGGVSRYRPMSVRAAGYPGVLTVSRNDIRLAVRETVTAPARVREQTRRVSQWRLGFDGLQRHLRGCNEYLPVPPHPSRLVHGDFEAFCRWAAEEKQLTVPPDTDFNHWSAFGARRLKQVRRHELLRHIFRRPLELWIVLDYAVFLEEQGYRVRLGEFCARSLTPRNLLIDATKKGAH
ncbi:methyltransferase [Marinobacter salinus]|uniref:methyltransferase n=1 Tax=Marinobacter salinus TaxID=1874317 RepID=UPI001D0D397F